VNGNKSEGGVEDEVKTEIKDEAVDSGEETT